MGGRFFIRFLVLEGLDCGFSHFLHLLLDVGDFDTEVFHVQNLRFAMRSTITSVAIAVCSLFFSVLSLYILSFSLVPIISYLSYYS